MKKEMHLPVLWYAEFELSVWKVTLHWDRAYDLGNEAGKDISVS